MALFVNGRSHNPMNGRSFVTLALEFTG